MKYVQRFLGKSLSLSGAIGELLQQDRDVRAELPSGAIVVPQTHILPGAQWLDLANGTRVVLQYELQTNEFRADMTLQYEEI